MNEHAFSELRASAPSVARAADEATQPWWHYGMVWFMLAGPAIAVVAASASAVIAYRHADIELTETPTATSLAAHATSAKR